MPINSLTQSRSGSYLFKSGDVIKTNVSNSIDDDISVLSGDLSRHSIRNPNKQAIVQLWNSNKDKDSPNSYRYNIHLNNLSGWVHAHNEEMTAKNLETIVLKKGEHTDSVDLHASAKTLFDFILRFKYFQKGYNLPK